MVVHGEEPELTGSRYTFKKLGNGVRIFPFAKIARPEMIEIGEGTMIDDFSFINGGRGITVGRFVHIASFVSIIGGGELLLGDYSVLACGARVLTGTDTYRSGKRMSTALPLDQRDVLVGKVHIERDAFVGTNAVVHPNVTIGEGAVVGSCSLVLQDIDPWTVNVGIPCRSIGHRQKIEREYP